MLRKFTLLRWKGNSRLGSMYSGGPFVYLCGGRKAGSMLLQGAEKSCLKIHDMMVIVVSLSKAAMETSRPEPS